MESRAARAEADREQTIAGLIFQWRAFADLVAGLDVSAAETPTRCTGWHVRDVAAHVAGQADDTISGAAGTRTADEQAAALRDQTPTALADHLRGATEQLAQLATVFDDATWASPSPIAGLTIGQGVHALLHDAYVHGDDIRAALGLPFDPGPGLCASLDFVLGALGRDDGRAHAASTDPRIARFLALPAADFAGATGINAHEFLLVATGRLDPGRLDMPETINIYR
jgi:uncharacterized protein (TIGR03083 family)